MVLTAAINWCDKQSTPGANGNGKMRWPSLFRILLVSAALAWMFSLPTDGQEAQITESKIKAAFLFNFAKLVEWPPESFATPETPIVFGILGKTPLSSDLEEITRSKTINNRRLEIKELRSPTECAKCQVVFVTAGEKRKLGEIIDSLNGASVLTVGDELDAFTDKGGIINFVREGKKFRFYINNEAAKKAKLKISSKLLVLAMPASH